MTKATRKPFAALFAALLITGGALSACDDQGPMEKAGEAADEAVSDNRRAIEDAAD